jgi:hypothetical protein
VRRATQWPPCIGRWQSGRAGGSPHVAPAFHFKLFCTASAGALNLKKGGFQGEVLARPGPGRQPEGISEALN